MFHGDTRETKGDGAGRTVTKPFAQQNRRVRRIVLAGMVATAALVVASAAQARALALYTAASPGPWLGSGAQLANDITCEAPDRLSPNIARYLQVNRQEIGRSPLYPGYYQDIYMQAKIQWSSDGFNWYTYQTHGWQKRSVAPGSSNYALFGLEYFDVSPYPRLWWRTRLEFRWYLAGTSTWLGTAIDTFTEDGISLVYGAGSGELNSTGEGVCYLP
jgi:hypothetical protein